MRNCWSRFLWRHFAADHPRRRPQDRQADLGKAGPPERGRSRSRRACRQAARPAGLGAKSEAKILASIELLHRRSDRIPWHRLAGRQRHGGWAQGYLPQVLQATVAGSLRRMQSTIGDIDLLASSEDSAAVMRALPRCRRWPRSCLAARPRRRSACTTAFRPTCACSSLSTGCCPAVLYRQQAHVVHIARFAQKRGLSLSEYGYKRQDGAEILTPEESEVYQQLGLPWIPPSCARTAVRSRRRRRGACPIWWTRARSGATCTPHRLERRRSRPVRDGRGGPGARLSLSGHLRSHPQPRHR